MRCTVKKNMSYQYGMAAFNLEMTDKVPRIEYSADRHWELVEKVTGIGVNAKSDPISQDKASAAFQKAWDYGFVWRTGIRPEELDKCRTKMGHATYASGGVDFDTEQTSPFEDPEEAYDFQPSEVYGTKSESELVAFFNKLYHNGCEMNSDVVNPVGTYISLVSGLLEIFGWDNLLMAMGIDANAFGETANRYAKWMQQYYNALAKCDAPVILIHDDIVWTQGAFVHPDWYRKFVFPNYKNYFAPILEAGKKIIFCSDGDYTQFVDDIAACGVNGFVMEPLTDMKYIAEKYGKTHCFIGNADTNVLLRGSKDDIYNEVKRCMDIGKNCPGFFMAVGNHIPSNTPVENALWYNECYEKLSRR